MGLGNNIERMSAPLVVLNPIIIIKGGVSHAQGFNMGTTHLYELQVQVQVVLVRRL